MIRRLLHFLVLAAIGLGARAWLEPRPRLVVEVPKGADPDPFVDEAVLLAEAERLGWIETDVVVRRHLVKVYGEATGQTDLDPVALFEEARAIGLHHADAVVRGRLLDRARRALLEATEPDEADLRAHWLRNADRFRSEPRYTVSLRFDDGERLPRGLRSPWIGTATQLRTRLGGDVADAVIAAPEGVWVADVRARGGAWSVRVDDVTKARVLPLDEVRAAVRADWRAEHARRDAEDRLARLRERWRIEVVPR